MNPLVLITVMFSKMIWVWNTIKKFPWLLKLIKNWKDVEKILNSLQNVYVSAVNNKGLPTCGVTRELVKSVRIAFEKDLIDLPNMNEAEVIDFLREIEANMSCAIEQAREVGYNER